MLPAPENAIDQRVARQFLRCEARGIPENEVESGTLKRINGEAQLTFLPCVASLSEHGVGSIARLAPRAPSPRGAWHEAGVGGGGEFATTQVFSLLECVISGEPIRKDHRLCVTSQAKAVTLKPQCLSTRNHMPVDVGWCQTERRGSKEEMGIAEQR